MNTATHSPSDRELLELAARAIGLQIVPESYAEEFGFTAKHYVGWWNPLTDGVDLLRLALKLRISINYETDLDEECETVRFIVASAGEGVNGFPLIREELMIENEEDIFEAAHRAIVRVAAEIGRSTK